MSSGLLDELEDARVISGLSDEDSAMLTEQQRNEAKIEFYDKRDMIK